MSAGSHYMNLACIQLRFVWCTLHSCWWHDADIAHRLTVSNTKTHAISGIECLNWLLLCIILGQIKWYTNQRRNNGTCMSFIWKIIAISDEQTLVICQSHWQFRPTKWIRKYTAKTSTLDWVTQASKQTIKISKAPLVYRTATIPN